MKLKFRTVFKLLVNFRLFVKFLRSKTFLYLPRHFIALNLNKMLLRNSSHVIRVNFFLFKWMFLTQFACMLIEVRTIFQHFNRCNRIYKSIIIFPNFVLRQKWKKWHNYVNCSECRTKIFMKNIHADFSSLKINVWIPNFV